MKEQQKQHLIDMMKADEELGLYDTKQTAVEWLVDELPKGDFEYQQKVIEQAKEMEKQQQGYSEEDMAQSFMAGWVENVPYGIECKVSFNEWFEQFKNK